MDKVWTRQELCKLLGVPPAKLKSWERSGVLGPTHKAGFQTAQAAGYTAPDVGRFQVIAHAARIGLQGSHLERVWIALETVAKYVRPGMRTLVVTTTAPDAWLIDPNLPGPGSVESLVRTLPAGVEICTVSVMEIPA